MLDLSAAPHPIPTLSRRSLARREEPRISTRTSARGALQLVFGLVSRLAFTGRVDTPAEGGLAPSEARLIAALDEATARVEGPQPGG